MLKISVSTIIHDFGFKIIFTSDVAKTKDIFAPTLLVPGVELNGFYDFIVGNEIVLLGLRGLTYLKTKTQSEQESIFKALIRETTPFILVADNQVLPNNLVAIAQSKQVMVVQSELGGNIVYMKVYDYLENYFAPKELFHGTLLEIYGQGVIIVGKSGIGKSEVALELIKKGHRLVADDAIIINQIGHEIHGRAPEHLKNYLEVRGIGLIDVYKMFGINSVADYKTIRYVIKLDHLEQNQTIKRLDEAPNYYRILETEVPCATILVGGGRNIADLVEVAVTNLRLKAKGIDPVKELVNKHNQLLEGGKHDD